MSQCHLTAVASFKGDAQGTSRETAWAHCLLYAGEPVYRSGSPSGLNKSKMLNLKSSSLVPKRHGVNPKSKIQNWLTSKTWRG